MSQTSSKPSLSSFGYRMHTLAGAGISIDEIAWRQLPVDLHRKIVELLDFSETVPADTSLAEEYSRSQAFRLAPNEKPLPRSMLARAERLSGMALAALSKPKARWTRVVDEGLVALMSDPGLEYM
ncbi:MAG: hypothetical protein CYPHOPRED_003018 [Cyphobasidiales sp. Tagirdzhanova-0007]|nr:MAG: hypothetical protein CYPHOPRED_003018 [Cyphobasidiales sp. Tagirdzhanova-0007]